MSDSLAFGSVHERLRGAQPIPDIRKYGLYKAEPTGEFMESDNQYMDVIVGGTHYYARPCYSFGAKVFAPSKEWLQKYKTQIFLWVAFEDGKPDKCVWLGWCWLNEKQEGIGEFPNTASFRTQFFTEEVCDIKKEWNRSFIDGKEEYTEQFTNKGWFAKIKSVLFEVIEKATYKSKQHVIVSDQIKIGSEDAREAMVLGNQLNNNLTQITNLLNTVIVETGLVASQAAAVASTAGNVPAGVALSQSATKLQTLGGQLQRIASSLPNHLSKKTTTE